MELCCICASASVFTAHMYDSQHISAHANEIHDTHAVCIPLTVHRIDSCVHYRCADLNRALCRYGMFTRAATRGERYQSALASSQVEESLRSIQVVKAHGYEQQEQKRYSSQLQKLVQLAYLKLFGYTVRFIDSELMYIPPCFRGGLHAHLLEQLINRGVTCHVALKTSFFYEWFVALKFEALSRVAPQQE